MDRTQGDNVAASYSKQDLNNIREFQQEQEEMAADAMEDSQEESFMNNQQFVEGYPSPEQDEKMNAHSFLHKAAFGENDTTRTTFLNEYELGRPLFSVRFMLKMEDISKYYLDGFCYNYKIPNKIAEYFKADVQNTTDSGMSNKGFAMNLNVTRRMDTMKRKARINNLKGGEEKSESG